MALVIGHRGAKALKPENTLQAIRAAASCRAEMVEVDVRLSKDGTLVLMHDDTVDRTTKGSGNVEDLSQEELKDLGVPTLSEALALVKDLSLGIVVEMKEEGLEEMVSGALTGTGINALIASFYHSSLREVKELSGLKTGIIISSLPVKPVDLALWADADAIFPKRVSPRMFKDAHRYGIKVYPWVINSAEEAAWMLKLGADGLVTDDPCLIRSVVDQPPKDTTRNNCAYYPCHHFEGQECIHCFCPLYPCNDLDLGRYVRTKRGKRVWTCIDCSLVHRPGVARYLAEHPDATTSELKEIDRKLIN
jgi:glycerophosphoryl diester phosphodiesterase